MTTEGKEEEDEGWRTQEGLMDEKRLRDVKEMERCSS